MVFLISVNRYTPCCLPSTIITHPPCDIWFYSTHVLMAPSLQERVSSTSPHEGEKKNWKYRAKKRIASRTVNKNWSRKVSLFFSRVTTTITDPWLSCLCSLPPIPDSVLISLLQFCLSFFPFSLDSPSLPTPDGDPISLLFPTHSSSLSPFRPALFGLQEKRIRHTAAGIEEGHVLICLQRKNCRRRRRES